MNYLQERLNRIESSLQTLIEGGAARFAAPDNELKEFSRELLEVFSKNIQSDEGDVLIAPEGFVLYINPAQSEEWNSKQALIDSLLDKLREQASDEGIQFLTDPFIQIEPKGSLPRGKFKIEVNSAADDLVQTSAVQIEGKKDADKIPSGAYLILDGIKVVNLEHSLINIGRKPDNQIVLNDARISRVHAQLRALKGQFVLFDLNSSGGTFVNGERIRIRTLQAGDVISMAGVPLIYGQESPNSDKTHDLIIE
jgi:hypothetical protein